MATVRICDLCKKQTPQESLFSGVANVTATHGGIYATGQLKFIIDGTGYTDADVCADCIRVILGGEHLIASQLAKQGT